MLSGNLQSKSILLVIALFGLSLAGASNQIHTVSQKGYTFPFDEAEIPSLQSTISKLAEEGEGAQITAELEEALPQDVIDFRKATKIPILEQTNTNTGNIFTKNAFSTTIYSQYYGAVLTGFKVSSYSYGTKCSNSIKSFLDDFYYVDVNATASKLASTDPVPQVNYT